MVGASKRDDEELLLGNGRRSEKRILTSYGSLTRFDIQQSSLRIQWQFWFSKLFFSYFVFNRFLNPKK
jgi:hypothetical protein